MLPVPSAPLADGDSFVVRGGENQTCRGASRRHPTNPSCTGESRPGPKWPANPPHSPLHPFLAVDAPGQASLAGTTLQGWHATKLQDEHLGQIRGGQAGFCKKQLPLPSCPNQKLPEKQCCKEGGGFVRCCTWAAGWPSPPQGSAVLPARVLQESLANSY